MKEIQLTQGKIALIDDEDYELVSQFRWNVGKYQNIFYAKRNIPLENGKQRTQKMHQLITGYKRTDHIDRNGLNNQRSNLREATHSQNMHNRGLDKNNTSGYKGVLFTGRKYRARIRVNDKLVHLGYFENALDAAIAYDKGAIKFFGEFARTNEMMRLYG